MKNLLPTLAVILLLPASLWAGAQSELQKCSENANDSACFGSSNSPSVTDVDAGGSTGQGSARLDRSTGRQGNLKADVDVPDAKPAKSKSHLGFLKKHGKMIMGALAAGGGAYFGYTHIAAFAGLGGPWGAAAMGAAAGLLLGIFVLPKLFHLFHHKKS